MDTSILIGIAAILITVILWLLGVTFMAGRNQATLQNAVRLLEEHIRDSRPIQDFVATQGEKQRANEHRINRLERKTGINGD